jgi:hypothetical protein
MRENEIPDLAGWVAYCETCGDFREARKLQLPDDGDGSEYFDFRCNACNSVLLTIQRADIAARPAKVVDIGEHAGKRTDTHC